MQKVDQFDHFSVITRTYIYVLGHSVSKYCTICFEDSRKVNKHYEYTLQVVDARLFTGSHDGTVKVWDIAGIKEDIGFTKAEGEEEIEEETQIIIDDDYPYGDEYGGETGSMFLASDPDLRAGNNNNHKDELMDMV